LQAQNVGLHNAPQDALKVQNPYAGQAQAISAGKKIYTSNCGACHGIGGKEMANIPPLANETISENARRGNFFGTSLVGIKTMGCLPGQDCQSGNDGKSLHI
jgi:mono/diheme cytochrome c family protein